MSDPRPRIDPAVLASILDSVPSRVRARLDRDPNIAATWGWKETPNGFEVSAGDELVRLECHDAKISDVNAVGCSCLLSPKCFHIVACVSALEIATSEPAATTEATKEDSGCIAPIESVAPDNTVSPSETIRETARVCREALNQVVKIGARASGMLVQSALLRCIHLCRATELPALANAFSRIVDNIRAIRSQLPTANANDLEQDLLVALEITERVINHATIDGAILGTSRRNYAPISIHRLEAWAAEPVLTRSGYAGICLHFAATDGELYQITEVRPGDGQLALQAYAGGIDLGTLTEAGRKLARASLLVQGMVASDDGRLGRGKQTRWALHGESSWSAGLLEPRFAVPIASQIANVFGASRSGQTTWAAESAVVERRGGWDLIAFDAQLLGPMGNAIIANVNGATRPWRLTIAVDHPELPYRSNLELLARCPGLRLRCVGRLRPDSAGDVDLLAIGPLDQGAAATSVAEKADENSSRNTVRFELPEAWQRRCYLGLDRLTEEHLVGIPRWGTELEIETRNRSSTRSDVEPLARRLQAVVLGGHRAIASADSDSHRRDLATLQRRNQFSGATLLQQLATASRSIDGQSVGTERRIGNHGLDRVVLATGAFVRATRRSLHQQEWLDY